MERGLKASDNLCGQTLLRLSASGSSIIAELARLSQNIPEAFSAGSQYAPVLFDFEYLKSAEEVERRVNTTSGMLDLDQEFMDSYAPILARFYELFESIVKYHEEYLEVLFDPECL